jgi:hypothetical protein
MSQREDTSAAAGNAASYVAPFNDIGLGTAGAATNASIADPASTLPLEEGVIATTFGPKVEGKPS